MNSRSHATMALRKKNEKNMGWEFRAVHGFHPLHKEYVCVLEWPRREAVGPLQGPLPAKGGSRPGLLAPVGALARPRHLPSSRASQPASGPVDLIGTEFAL
jgi:hypothetical protein